MSNGRFLKWSGLDVGGPYKGRYFHEMISTYRSLKHLVDTYTKRGEPLPPRLKQQLPVLRNLERYLANKGFI